MKPGTKVWVRGVVLEPSRLTENKDEVRIEIDAAARLRLARRQPDAAGGNGFQIVAYIPKKKLRGRVFPHSAAKRVNDQKNALEARVERLEDLVEGLRRRVGELESPPGEGD